MDLQQKGAFLAKGMPVPLDLNKRLNDYNQSHTSNIQQRKPKRDFNNQIREEF